MRKSQYEGWELCQGTWHTRIAGDAFIATIEFGWCQKLVSPDVKGEENNVNMMCIFHDLNWIEAVLVIRKGLELHQSKTKLELWELDTHYSCMKYAMIIHELEGGNTDSSTPIRWVFVHTEQPKWKLWFHFGFSTLFYIHFGISTGIFAGFYKGSRTPQFTMFTSRRIADQSKDIDGDWAVASTWFYTGILHRTKPTHKRWSE